MKHQLSEQLINTILNYLANKPFIEVAEIIGTLQKELQSQQQKIEKTEGEKE